MQYFLVIMALTALEEYCNQQQWSDNLAVVPYVPRTVPEITQDIQYVTDTVTGLPLYSPTDVHKDHLTRVCAAIKEENQQQKKFVCDRHLDNVLTEVDEKHLQKVKSDIDNVAENEIERLKELYPSCFKEEVDFKDPSLVGVTHSIEAKKKDIVDCIFNKFTEHIKLKYTKKLKIWKLKA